MSLLSFLVETINLDIQLFLQDGKLKVDAAKGALTEEIKLKLQESKSDIITLFEKLNIFSNKDISLPSFAQQRLWVIDQMVGESLQYHIPMTMAFNGGLNIAALEHAFNQIVKRHESLRTVFVNDGTSVFQVVRRYQPLNLPLIDIQNVADKEAELDRLISEEMQNPFDLSQDLMVRLFVVQDQSERFVLLGSMHHINMDGWSMNIVIQELETYYSAYINNQEDLLPTLELQYADYARWQRNHLKGDVLDSYLNYWKCKLEAVPKLHALPLDHVRPQQLSNKGKTLRQRLELDIRHGLEALAQAHNATLFMVLHAAFSYFLSRYSGENDIVIGTPIANREKAQLASIIGFFVNTLPLRSTFVGEQSFGDLIEASKQTILGAYAHQQLPFEKIIDELQIERSVSFAPLCQIMLSFQDWGRGNRDDAEINFPDVKLEHIEHHSEFSQFELTLTAMPVESGFVMEWEFSTDLFEADTISNMMASFETLLRSLIADSASPVNSLPMLSPSQMDSFIKQVLGLTQEQQNADFDNDLCIHEAFELQADKYANKTALVFEQQRLTYDELNQQANVLAHFLVKQGVGPESLVGVYLDRSHFMVLTILGILKSGAAYVPLDISFPMDRIEMLLDETQINQIVTQGTLAHSITGYQNSINTINIDELLQANTELFSNIKREQNSVSAENLAYIVFTSGSTGKPKGVMVDHRSMMVRLEGWDKAFSLYENPPCVIQMAGITVDICLGDIVKSLLTGGKLVVASKETLLTPEEFVALMDKELINFGDFVPAVLRMMVEYLLSHCKTLEALRYILVGSESWYGKDLINLKRVISSDAKCMNIYGQTESIIDVSYADVTHKDIEADAVVPIGSALAHTGLYILNNENQFQPAGVAGELHIGGEGLARGYLNQPELTAEKFICNPFTKGRMYKTGDQARWLSDGTLEFLGRVDHQVKIRGFRIELPEVEAEISKLANVKQVLVVAKEVSLGDKRLVAYIQKLDESKVTDHDFIKAARNELKTKLPQYMQPYAFVVITEFPITVTGKVDRYALPEAEYSVEQDYVAPTNELEMQLCQIWQDILNAFSVGITDNFFSLGGDSILAVRLVAQAKHKGVPFSVKDLLTHQTVSELAIAICSSDVESQSIEEKPKPFALVEAISKSKLQELGYQDAYPLSYLQRQMIEDSWLHGSYHDVMSEAMSIPWDEKAFRNAWQDMLDQYPILRSVFDFSNTPALQCVLADYQGPIEIINWQGKSFSQLETDMSSWFIEETKRQYDFNIPLWRMTVHIYGNNEFIFIFANHHAILDGWSAALLIPEFVQRYQDYYQNKASQLKPELLSFSAYIAAEINAIQSKESEAFWQQHLKGSELPYWTGKEAHDIYRISDDYSDLSAQLEGTARTLSVSPRSILLAIHMWVLAQVNGSNNITCSVNRHGRLEVAGGDTAIGLFLNPLPLSVNTEQPSWRNLVIEVDQLQISSWTHRHYPVALLEQKLNLDLSACLFNYVDFQVNHSKENDGSADGNNTSSYIWECVFIHRRELGELSLRLSFEDSTFNEHTRNDILYYYGHALKSIVYDPLQKADNPFIESSVTG
ncbi:amino acid adenylation domain-containing protein [Pseudoalteromonas sp. ASV78]|uniref:amino acid adenylation domain-containing protein n=1 Tax=Pseudoalteromonas sp. ASV78 TaxID=3397851 RepID=UPI0039FD216B